MNKLLILSVFESFLIVCSYLSGYKDFIIFILLAFKAYLCYLLLMQEKRHLDNLAEIYAQVRGLCDSFFSQNMYALNGRLQKIMTYLESSLNVKG